MIRTLLTVVGILLLVVFGSRAAAQARDMRLAGATHRSVLAVGTNIMSALGFGKANTAKMYEATPILENIPSQIQTAAPLAVPATGDNSSQKAIQPTPSTSQTNASNGQHKAVGTVNNVATKTQQTVSNISKSSSDDFTNLWP